MTTPDTKVLREAVYEVVKKHRYDTLELAKSGMHNDEEATQSLLTLIEKSNKEAVVGEYQKMVKMHEDYYKKIREDQERGIYQPSFGSASGAIANAGWVSYFKDRINTLKKEEKKMTAQAIKNIKEE
jgi:hypothetical protein